jgi:hypothetical protein
MEPTFNQIPTTAESPQSQTNNLKSGYPTSTTLVNANDKYSIYNYHQFNSPFVINPLLTLSQDPSANQFLDYQSLFPTFLFSSIKVPIHQFPRLRHQDFFKSALSHILEPTPSNPMRLTPQDLVLLALHSILPIISQIFPRCQ